VDIPISRQAVLHHFHHIHLLVSRIEFLERFRCKRVCDEVFKVFKAEGGDVKRRRVGGVPLSLPPSPTPTSSSRISCSPP
jgi:hypothetical protein